MSFVGSVSCERSMSYVKPCTLCLVAPVSRRKKSSYSIVNASEVARGKRVGEAQHLARAGEASGGGQHSGDHDCGIPLTWPPSPPANVMSTLPVWWDGGRGRFFIAISLTVRAGVVGHFGGKLH